jgi:hypothetical protein
MFIAIDAPDAGTIASAMTTRGSAEPVNAKVIQCASVNCPFSLGLLTQRNLIIERVAEDGEILLSGTYAVPATGDRDRALTFNVDVAVFPGAAVRARFDNCSAGETQWVVINYSFEG